MRTIVLLFISNTFMTFAWYGHLKHRSAPLLEAIVLGWLIAFGEYCFRFPPIALATASSPDTNSRSFRSASTLTVFAIFARLYLGERIRWNYASLSFRNRRSGLCVLGNAVIGSARWASNG